MPPPPLNWNRHQRGKDRTPTNEETLEQQQMEGEEEDSTESIRYPEKIDRGVQLEVLVNHRDY